MSRKRRRSLWRRIRRRVKRVIYEPGLVVFILVACAVVAGWLIITLLR